MVLFVLLREGGREGGWVVGKWGNAGDSDGGFWSVFD